MLQPNEVLEQSRAAQRQWGPTWEKHAKENGEILKEVGTNIKDLLHTGAGKTLLCVAMGNSFEHKIDIIKKYRDNVDIACCDKSVKNLVENDIIPDYVFVADAGIDFDVWCKPYIDKIPGAILLSNVTANPKWARAWVDAGNPVYYYVNKDNIQTEAIYGPMAGCDEQIPASSCVGNSVVVFACQILGYDRYLLVGYDYGWRDEDKYYAFNDSDKRYWMKHANVIDRNGTMLNLSQNLLFSARWLSDYHNAELQKHGVSLIDCSGDGILQLPKGDLEKYMKSSKTRTLSQEEKNNIISAHVKTEVVNSSPNAPEELQSILSGKNVAQVVVKYIPQEVMQWVNQLN